MSTATTASAPTRLRRGRPPAWRAFLAVLRRDLYVTARELPAFLAQVILQPLFLLFVFGRVLTDLGYASGGYAQLLFPGIMALTCVVTAVQSISVPLVVEFSWTREIEDRLLAPLPTSLLALEKMLYAALRAILATAVIVPVGALVLGSVPWRWDGVPLLVAVVVLGASVGAALGLVLGTSVPPKYITIMLALVFTPLAFTGCAQYPWPSLTGLRWFQVVSAANPMTYVSEGTRAALVPRVPHIEPWLCLLVLVGATALLGWLGIAGFRRRAID